MSNNLLTLATAVKLLFGFELAHESPVLKNRINSFVRNGLLAVSKEQKVQRAAVYIHRDQLTTLFNALLINTLINDPQHVKSVFDSTEERRLAASVFRSALLQQTTLAGMALRHEAIITLVSQLEGEDDLRKERLANPFAVLPQRMLPPNTGLFQMLLAQAASLSPDEGLMLAWLQGDLQKAKEMADALTAVSGPAAILRERILADWQEAREFDDFLDQNRFL